MWTLGRIVVRKFVFALTTMLALLVVTAACGADPTPTPAPTPTAMMAEATPTAMVEKTLEERLYEEALATNGGRVSWLFPTQEAQAKAIKEAFEAEYPGLTLVHTQKTSAEVGEQLVLEHQAGKISADVADPGRDLRLFERGIFVDSKDVFDDIGIPEGARYSNNQAMLNVPLAHGVIYNTERVTGDDIPQTYEDLLDPKWKNDIVLEDRLKGFVYLTDIEEYNGRYENLWPEEKILDYLTKLSAQEPKILHGNTSVWQDVASGESAISPDVNFQSIGSALETGTVELAPVTPNAIEQFLIGAVADGPNPAGGKLFLRWSQSPTQGLPVRVSVQPGSTLDPATGDPIAVRAERYDLKIGYTGIELAAHFGRLQATYREALGIPTN